MCAALFVVHDGDLEPRPTWDHGMAEVADVGEIFSSSGETRPPALRITIASPSSSSRKADGSVRGLST
jgi:hypothetical protein